MNTAKSKLSVSSENYYTVTSPSHILATCHPDIARHSPLRRLALSMLFTIMTSSYQTTCTSLPGYFNKRHMAMHLTFTLRHYTDYLYSLRDVNAHANASKSKCSCFALLQLMGIKNGTLLAMNDHSTV